MSLRTCAGSLTRAVAFRSGKSYNVSVNGMDVDSSLLPSCLQSRAV